ncbi:ABC transporter permease [Microlunatus sp. GCM10028923]|uniref:ABC transporter permease n=1 Tax=Microlunatus sp. GCM10028923 TaxID=3273400 RepID=UPI00361EA583
MTRPTAGMIIALLRLGAANALFFRANVIASAVGAGLQTILLVTVWRVVYLGRDQVAGVTADRAVAYAVLALALTHLALPFRLSTLAERVRLGTIATDVIRPVGIVTQNLATTLGATAGALPGLLVVILLGAALGGIQPPAGPVQLVAFVPSALLGLALAMIANLTVSMVSFWTTDTRGAFYIYRTVAGFSSGALVPLWFMPAALTGVLQWLPFPLLIFAPLQLWFGDDRPVGTTLLAQVGWLIVLTGILLLVRRQALRKVVINGG